MPEKTIEDRVRDIIAEQLNMDPVIVTPATELKAMGADSLDVVEIQMALDEEFGIELEDEKVENFTTVGSIIESVTQKYGR